MIYCDRNGKQIIGNEGQDHLLLFLYKSIPGRMLLKVLTRPLVSKIGGAFLNTRISTLMIGPFVKKSHIDMGLYQKSRFESYNAFFCRKIKEEMRPISMERGTLISPCDGKLTSYPITKEGRFRIKNTEYTMHTLLRDPKLAKKYLGGDLLVFRLTVDDYHRYCYIADGKKTQNRYIQGIFHSVNPISAENAPIYKENSREYSLLFTEEFGSVLMMEVGALMVGRIVNEHGEQSVKRGMEKGHFEFGGSTIVLCFEKGRIQLDEDLVRNNEKGIETIVKMGEKIGCAR